MDSPECSPGRSRRSASWIRSPEWRPRCGGVGAPSLLCGNFRKGRTKCGLSCGAGMPNSDPNPSARLSGCRTHSPFPRYLGEEKDIFKVKRESLPFPPPSTKHKQTPFLTYIRHTCCRFHHWAAHVTSVRKGSAHSLFRYIWIPQSQI